MGELVLAGIVPHPPIMISEIGKGETKKVQATRRAMGRLALKLNKESPDTIVIITPHGAIFSDTITISLPEKYIGNLSRFGAGQIKFNYQVDYKLADLVYEASIKRKIAVAKLDPGMAGSYGVDLDLDHGMTVPLSFFTELEEKPKLLQVNVGFLAREELYHFGIALREGIERSGQKVAVIASSDLSHKLLPGAPAGYSPKGKEFDFLLKELLEDFNVEGILEIPKDLQEEAGECGYRPIIMLLGTLKGLVVESEVLSYEGPFGVGYLVSFFKIKDRLHSAEEIKNLRFKEKEQPLSTIVELARQSLSYYFKHGKKMKGKDGLLDESYPKKAGVFVTLKKDGRLRGCIGTIEATKESLAEEVIANAIKAAVEDPRFEAVTKEELDELTISVDVLEEPEAISSIEDLDPKKYGVIVKSGWKRGLLLPLIEGVNTPQEQVEIAREKAGIIEGETIELERFKVTRYA